MTRAAVLLLAAALAACGGGGRRPPSGQPTPLPVFSPAPPLTVTAPDPITDSIAFWADGRIWNPERGRAFNVEVTGGLDLEHVMLLLGGVVRATDARVGFVHETTRPFDFHVALAPEHQLLQNPWGGQYAGVAYFHGSAGRITEGHILVSSPRWGDAARVISHEAGHAALGLWHVQPPVCDDCMMGGDLPLDALEFSPAEVASIRWKLAQRDGALRDGGPDVGRASAQPSSYICRLEVRGL